ncbi:MAG: hypothetical protein Kow009_04750 [Spirochaetales bacterium]
MRNKPSEKKRSPFAQGDLSTWKRPELLAPAGSFSAAYHAFRAGADAVYFGLKEFSARRGARNFTMEEVARLKSLSASRGKRIYAALNTVIRNEELEDVATILYDLQALEVDGVIIQDLGVLYLLRRWFPRIPIHASTQMAVHNVEGVQTLKALGVQRIVLARELTLEELGKIRNLHPDVELEVFIHGALCYSVSGLCLASGMLLGRSGNRGECAQICRGWFEWDSGAGGGPREGYFFSCKDLAVGEGVRELRRIGIDSFKIEGRLKSPEWVAAVTAYYRSILDREEEAQNPSTYGPGSREESPHLERARWIFSRSLTAGYASTPTGMTSQTEPKRSADSTPPPEGVASSSGFPGILDPRFPGHRGIPIGKVQAVEGKFFLLRPEKDLATRDGLQFFRPLSGLRMEAVPFGIETILPENRKKPVRSSKAGQPVWIEAPDPPPPGTEIFLISTHADTLPVPPGNIKPKRIPLELKVELKPGSGTASRQGWITLRLETPQVSASPTPPGSNSPEHAPPDPLVVWRGEAIVEESRSGLPAEDVFARHVSPPGDSPFHLRRISVDVGNIGFSSIFIPPSRLKEIRRELYQKAVEAWEQRKSSYVQAVLEALHSLPERSASCDLRKEDQEEGNAVLWGRKDVEPPSRDRLILESSGMPFVTDVDLAVQPSNNPDTAKLQPLFLPLAPVLFHPEAYWEALERFIRTCLEQDPSSRVYLGLNNIGHIPFALRFREEDRVRFFVDYGLYMANRFALRLVREMVSRLDFYYPWIEGRIVEGRIGQGEGGTDEDELPTGSSGDFSPPLFTGRACVYRSLPGGGGCSSCPYPSILRQGNRTFLLTSTRVGGICLNFLFISPPSLSGSRPCPDLRPG